ncbi:hypothetical protein EVB32_112 [Rhizobium phage RHph_TM39]|uniref:Uncharacterized protein n=1 Tax=Rhizobium phage RHph_TM30 TaxID=2509764 RepID=A0A7S5RFR1_9CAUD|nr:hypothetical protein PQC16_gp112 [Rhizobium phage RHph_TM30]QIG71583.1 hypothetical protein EVB94_112 [Rhizobium phage RHph_TM40]QIG71946.1 hypothetical protein EVB95_112 [Rhizobium phage RHph_TM2_3B]QIG72308.1 hypothetical protein EVB96_112 [Rhizobium phage RHph_TM3_3_6]QIG77100.1 hypothetical protein EVB32_112 [Rhizobium phage RHph_TM39]QIG77438.1 hypothetical protein EVB61_110 [Rhizobium phage RHph_TM21B]QIG77699.1 hypothetical protein EVB64_112 [Rhizobium phage RHph_TM61]
MSSRQDLSTPHRCLVSKCKGSLVDPKDSYGKYAYWWGKVDHPRDSGWHNAPRPENYGAQS